MSGTRYLARLGDRSLFPDLEPKAYLNHAAISAPSVAVQAAAREVLDDYGRRGMGALMRWVSQRDRLREKLGRLVGAAADEVALTKSTQAGVTAIALCFPWEAGDRVVVFEGEFPANVTPWQRAAELFELEVVFQPLKPFARDHREGLEALDAVLDQGARLVAVSAVQFASGLRMPLAAIGERCRARGTRLFVDAIQAVGVVPVDMRAMGVDYLAGGAHKWLMGLEGGGYLAASAERAGELRPHVAGWLSHDDPISFLMRGPGHLRYDRPIRDGIRFVEAGSENAVGAAALGAAIDLIEQIGVEDIYAHVQAYLDPLEEALVERGFHSVRSPAAEARSGILSVVPPDGRDPVALHAALVEQGIAVSLPNGLLRFAPHWPNGLDEVEAIVKAVDALLG